MKKIRHFYNNITIDQNLKNGAEKELIKMFAGWTVMMNRDSFDSGLSTIACESGYSRDHLKQDVIPNLIRKGYLTVIRKGFGKTHSKYKFNIPNYYIFPVKKEIDEDIQIKMAKVTLVKKAGVDIYALDSVVADGIAKKAIKKAKAFKRLQHNRS